MSKNINIHIKTPGAAQAKQQLDSIGKSSQQVGHQTAAGQKQAAAATEKTAGKLTGMGRILGTLKTQVFAFLGAWVGLQAITTGLQVFIDKLERIQQKQKEVVSEGMPILDIGQALEMQTGTVGKQQYWAGFVSKLQTAGSLKSPEAGGQLAIAIDVAMQKRGGIQSQGVQALALKLAPMFGAAQMGGEEIAKFFEFASTMKVEQTEQGYQKAFSQLLAGYRSAKTTQGFGAYVTGLQKGATGYLGQGGTPEQAIALFTTAREVMSNESLAATLLEQTTRFSTGAYEKPRQAIEKALGIRWENLSMDQRADALLQYISSIPEAQRTQVLVEQGFEPGLASEIGKMVTPEGQSTLATTREAVYSASTKNLQAQIEAYRKSISGKSRQIKGQRSQDTVAGTGRFGDWQNRLDAAQDKLDILIRESKDRFMVPDKYEAHFIAYEEMLAELNAQIEQAKDSDTPEAKEWLNKAKRLRANLKFSIENLSTWYQNIIPDKLQLIQKTTIREGAGYEQELQSLQQQAPITINNNYDYSMKYFPRVGSDLRGPRFPRIKKNELSQRVDFGARNVSND